MPSPFPGMNPFFEQPDVWEAFHGRFFVFLQNVLGPQIVPRYFVNLEGRIYLDHPDEDAEAYRVADAAIRPGRRGSRTGGAAVLAAPTVTTIPVSELREKRTHWLTVRDKKQREIVTVIELLSPSNERAGLDRERYLKTRDELLQSAVHFVEIDLLRGGGRLPFRQLPKCDYYAMVSRRQDRPTVGVWPFSLRDPLPDIPIPLRPGEAEPKVSLKAVLDKTYDDAGYEYVLYDESPVPKLPRADAAWAKQYIPKALD